MITLLTRTVCLVSLVCALALPAQAQQFTPAQLSTIKAAILADATLAALPSTDLGNATIASALNAPSAPAVIVWKTSVSRNEIGKAFVATALAAITAGNNDKLANFAQWNETVDPSRADQREFFNDIFSVAAGASTRAALDVLWRRTARRIEALFTTGTGTTQTPATLVFEGTISAGDVELARNS